MKLKVLRKQPVISQDLRNSQSFSSDEIAHILQAAITGIYADTTDTVEKAKEIMNRTILPFQRYLKMVVTNNRDDDALAILSELDHKLVFPTRKISIRKNVSDDLTVSGIRKVDVETEVLDSDFVFEYDVDPTGSSESPYDLKVVYGDRQLGLITITVNKIVQPM